jgi:hypothetical protein
MSESNILVVEMTNEELANRKQISIDSLRNEELTEEHRQYERELLQLITGEQKNRQSSIAAN